jgi:competence/damage-inducible protein CinA-like protein
MDAEILSIGTEILLGEILDTNAQYIASHLPALGINLYRMSQIGDNQDRLANLLRDALTRSELVLCTGGLGPTEDDVTRNAIAEVLQEDVHIDAQLEAELRAGFARRGNSNMPERNLKQAWLTPSTKAIPNPHGTAPGWWAEKDGKIIIAMPGPPAEMTRMWDEEVEPRLRERSTGVVIVSRTVKTVGIGEGQVDEMVSPLLKSTNPSIGVYAKADGIHLRITARSQQADEGFRMIEPVEAELRKILGPAVWGTDDDSLESSIIRMLGQRRMSLATMESCTGGLLASVLTDAPGASEEFKGGLVTYTIEAKVAFGVPAEVIEQYGVISKETAIAMASAARAAIGADIGVGITGVAGPAPQDGHPVGEVHIGLDDGRETSSLRFNFPQRREAVKRRAVTNALQLIRKALLAQD